MILKYVSIFVISTFFFHILLLYSKVKTRPLSFQLNNLALYYKQLLIKRKKNFFF